MATPQGPYPLPNGARLAASRAEMTPPAAWQCGILGSEERSNVSRSRAD